jgi:hypothetical protein
VLARRNVVKGAILTAVSLTAGEVAPALALDHRQSSLDNHASVTRSRLDTLVASAYPDFDVTKVLHPFDAAKDGARYDVDLYRLTTTTRIPETGEVVKISGLLAMPVGVKGKLPVVSWQHGTILSFVQVPSNLTLIGDPDYVPKDSVDSLETLFNVQRFAGNGYAVIAADYIGKGPYRDGRHEAYAVKDATIGTCIDMLQAGLSQMRLLGHGCSALFLNGWSQGSLNTQWLRQELQRRQIPVAAAAVESPFSDLNESFRFWTSLDSYPNPTSAAYPDKPLWLTPCMIICLGSYETYYGFKGLMRSAIKPQYFDIAAAYWQSYAMDASTCPAARDLLVAGFFDHYTAAVNSDFLRQLAANRATYFLYDAPVRFYYGLADEAVHPAMVHVPLAADGPFVAGVAVANASHRQTFLASLYGSGDEISGQSNTVEWFNAQLPR